MVPIAGFLGDIFSRRSILLFCIAFWSISTFFTGFAGGLFSFVFLLGIATGGGEAFYAPAANAMLGENYKNNRAFALSIHQTAVYAGIILSGVLAGYIGEKVGWRSSFHIFGAAGVILAIVFMLRVKPEHKKRTKIDHKVLATMKDALLVFKKPTVILLTLAFACMVFVNIGYLTWMPLYLVEQYGMSITYAGFSSLIYHHIGAFLGVLIGAKIADNQAKLNPKSRLIIQTIALIGGAPFIFLMGFADNQMITYVALAVFGLMRGIYDSNIFASLYEVVQPTTRSSVTGFMLMFAFLMGAFAPLIMGVLKPTLGLAVSFSCLSAFYVLGGIFILMAVLFWFKKDYCDDK
ncbi:D-galactonate transporter [bioreactor metagenome]|uniref:D-galactonate transporter n=1 Tax=bioreactor metagenome TaxID=1076179 RepID=A0A645CI72_9ZZZZ